MVKSSVASKRGGFLKGGRISEGVDTVDEAERRVIVVVTLVIYSCNGSAVGLDNSVWTLNQGKSTHFILFILELEYDIITINSFTRNLTRNECVF